MWKWNEPDERTWMNSCVTGGRERLWALANQGSGVSRCCFSSELVRTAILQPHSLLVTLLPHVFAPLPLPPPFPSTIQHNGRRCKCLPQLDRQDRCRCSWCQWFPGLTAGCLRIQFTTTLYRYVFLPVGPSIDPY